MALPDTRNDYPAPPVAATAVAASVSDRMAGPSLREVMRKRLKSDILGTFATGDQSVVMLVDAFTVHPPLGPLRTNNGRVLTDASTVTTSHQVKIVSSLIRMSELFELNVHLVATPIATASL